MNQFFDERPGWTATYPNNSAVKDRVSLPSVVTFVDWGTTGLDALMDTESMMTTTMVDMLLRLVARQLPDHASSKIYVLGTDVYRHIMLHGSWDDDGYLTSRKNCIRDANLLSYDLVVMPVSEHTHFSSVAILFPCDLAMLPELCPGGLRRTSVIDLDSFPSGAEAVDRRTDALRRLIYQEYETSSWEDYPPRANRWDWDLLHHSHDQRGLRDAMPMVSEMDKIKPADQRDVVSCGACAVANTESLARALVLSGYDNARLLPLLTLASTWSSRDNILLVRQRSAQQIAYLMHLQGRRHLEVLEALSSTSVEQAERINLVARLGYLSSVLSGLEAHEVKYKPTPAVPTLDLQEVVAAADLLHRVPVPWGVGGVRITSGAPLPRPDFVDLSSSLLPASSSPLVVVHSHTSDEEVSGSGRGGSVSDQGAMDRMQEEEGGEEEEEEDGMLGWDRVSADPGRPGGIWILGNEGGHFAPDSSGRGDEGARGASVSANLFPLQGPLSSSGPWGSASVGHNSAREEENDDEEQGEAMVGEGGGRDSKRGREEEEEEDGGPSKKSKKPWRAPEQGFVLFYMRAQQVLLDAPELASSIQLARNIGPVMRELVIDEVNISRTDIGIETHMKALRLLDRDGQDGKIEAALAAWPDLRVDDSLLIKPRRQRSTIPSRQSAPSSQPQGKFPSRGGLGSLGFFGPQSDASASSLQPPLPSPATSPSALLLPGPRLQPSAFNAQLPNPAQPNLAAQRQDRQEQQQQGVTLLPSAAYAAPPSSSNGGYGSISGASLNNQGRGNGGQLQQMARQSGQVSQSRDLHPRSLRPGPPENAAASLAEGSGPLADALLRGHHHPLEGLTPSFTAPPASDLRVAAASVLAGRAARQPAPAAIALAAAAAGLQPPRQQQQQQQQGRIATMGEARAKNWRQNTSQGALLPLIPNSAPIGGEWQSVRSLVQNPQALAILQLKSHSCHGQVVSERRADHGASSSCSPRLLDVDKWLCRLTVKGIGGNQGNQLTLEYCCPHHSSFVRQQ